MVVVVVVVVVLFVVVALVVGFVVVVFEELFIVVFEELFADVRVDVLLGDVGIVVGDVSVVVSSEVVSGVVVTLSPPSVVVTGGTEQCDGAVTSTGGSETSVEVGGGSVVTIDDVVA